MSNELALPAQLDRPIGSCSRGYVTWDVIYLEISVHIHARRSDWYRSSGQATPGQVQHNASPRHVPWVILE